MEAQSKFFGGDGHNIFGHWQAKAVGQPGLPACFSFLLVTQEDGCPIATENSLTFLLVIFSLFFLHSKLHVHAVCWALYASIWSSVSSAIAL